MAAKFDELRTRHLVDVRNFTSEAAQRLEWSREQVRDEQTRRLRKVVAHAQQASPLHADRLGHLEASKLELSDLAKIPPMTKATVMDNWDRLVTDDRLHLDEVMTHLDRLHAGDEHNAYYLNQYYAAATGGTSGKRGVFLWDWETFVVTANITYRMDARLDRMNPPPHPRRTAVICAGSYVHASRFLFPTSLDPQRHVCVLPAGLPIDELVDQLNEYQPDRIVGYASIVEELDRKSVV